MADADPPLSSIRTDIDPLAALRCMAIIFVFMCHIYGFSKDNGYLVTGGWETIFVTPAWAGVWILFIISGYLAGNGFFNNRYEFSLNGIIRYYLSRFIKIMLPTYIFISLCYILFHPDFLIGYPEVLISFFTFTYNGRPGVIGIGATWYVFTVFWMYISAPVICYILKKIDEKIQNTKVIWILILSVVLIFGLANRTNQLSNGLDWYTVTYTSVLTNMDLFICGILLNLVTKYINSYFNTPFKLKSFQHYAILIIIILFVTNAYYDVHNYFDLYAYYYPTFWAIGVSLFIISFSQQSTIRKEPSLTQVIKHPMDSIQFFASISFEFYLWHSVVASSISSFFTSSTPLVGHISLLLVTFIITIYISILFHKSLSYVTSSGMQIVNTFFKK